MKPSKASAALWDRANKRTSAEMGLGDPADAKYEILTIKQLIRSIGTNPNALELLAVRQHELSPEQRRAVLKAACPPTSAPKPKVTKAAPKASPPVPRGMSGISLWGKTGAPRP